MKSTYNLLWIFILPFLAFGQLEEAKSLESYIEIEGYSNVNSFELKASWDNPNDYTSINEFNQFNLEVPFSNFKTKKKVIYNDFLEMVKNDKYPELKISFSTSDITNPLVNTIECDITLSGITKRYSVPVYCFQVGTNSYYIKGSNSINLSSFLLEPPTKLFKLIKIKEEIDVNFALLVKNEKLEFTSMSF